MVGQLQYELDGTGSQSAWFARFRIQNVLNATLAKKACPFGQSGYLKLARVNPREGSDGFLSLEFLGSLAVVERLLTRLILNYFSN